MLEMPFQTTTVRRIALTPVPALQRVGAIVALLVLLPLAARADIRDIFGDVIPGTETTFLEPGVQLDHLNLMDAEIEYDNLVGASLVGTRLSFAHFFETDLTNANLTGANLSSAYLSHTVLTAANLTGADLSYALLWDVNLTEANLTGANITFVDFSQVTGWFTKEQFYSTANYQSQRVDHIGLSDRDLERWDFRGQRAFSINFRGSYLEGARFDDADLTFAYFAKADLSGASFENADLSSAIGLSSAYFDDLTTYNQWTRFPADFDPVAAGLSLHPSPIGDLNGDDLLSLQDLDRLSDRISGRVAVPAWLPDAAFDINADGIISGSDLETWVVDIKQVWFGDANLDNRFDTSDLVSVFAAGEYEDAIDNNSVWATGDWNADADFTSSDLIVAFQEGGYEQGTRVKMNGVPEPTSWGLLLFASMGLLAYRHRTPHRNRAVSCSRTDRD